MEKKRNLVLVGDIHGEYRTLIWKALTQKKIVGADIVVLGDFGVGFDNSLAGDYAWSERRLEKADCIVWALRGNHDDPSYFTPENPSPYPRLKFMEDYKTYTLGGDREVLIIGGANSVDIEDRQRMNKEYEEKGLKKRCWWEGEDVKRIDPDKLPLKVDIILSHESPLIFDPTPSRPESCPLYQYEKILATRKYLSGILDKVRTDSWFFGHYHKPLSGSYNGTLWRGLDIMELYQAPEKKNHNPQGEDD